MAVLKASGWCRIVFGRYRFQIPARLVTITNLNTEKYFGQNYDCLKFTKQERFENLSLISIWGGFGKGGGGPKIVGQLHSCTF
jgi:hypothetical protein